MALTGDEKVGPIAAVSAADESGSGGEGSVGEKPQKRVSDSENSEEVRQRILEQQAEIRNETRLTTNLSSLWKRDRSKKRLDEIATQPSVFDDPELAKYFRE